MANDDVRIPEDWYPGYFLDPRNAWKWMPAAFPGWLPSAMVRTPPAIPPERWPDPSASSTPGLLDGLAELARPKSSEEQLAELRRMSLIPDSLGGEARSQPQSAPSSWVAGAQWNGAPAAAWPDAPAPKSVAQRDDADLTPEMHRSLLDAYFRYADRKSEPETMVWPQFMRSALILTPPSGQAAWPDAAATEAAVNAPNAGIPGELPGALLPMMPRPPQQAPDPGGAVPLFMQSAMMPTPPQQTPDQDGAAPLFVQSGMMTAPPSGHAAPDSLDLSDPWAVAAYRQRNAVRPTFGRGDPERTEAAIRAGLVSAADPFGIPSFLIGQVSPATKDLIREQYEDQPIPSMIGSLAASTPRSVMTAFEAAAKAAPKMTTALLGLGGATFSADEAEAGRRPPKFGKGRWGRPSAVDKFWRNVPTELDQPIKVQEAVWLDPATLRWSQRTAGGKGGADILRTSMRKKGYSGDPIDVVRTPDGLTTIDHTRPMVAMELGIERIPARVHDPSDLVPPDKYRRFGGRKTWGEVLADRLDRQDPPLPPTGTTVRPRLPKERK